MSRNYVRIFRGRWKAVVALCLVGIIAGWITAPSERIPPQRTFAATHILLAESPSPQAGGGLQTNGQSLEAAAFLLTAGEVPAIAAAALNIDPEELVSSLLTSTDAKTGTIRITAINPDGDRSALEANTLASGLLAFLGKRATDRYEGQLREANEQLAAAARDLDALPRDASRTTAVDPVEQAQRDSVLRRFESANSLVAELTTQGVPSSGFVTVEEAKPFPVDIRAVQGARQASQAQAGTRAASGASQTLPTLPSNPAPAPESGPSPVLRIQIAGTMGLLLGLAFALLRERLDPRIRSREDAEVAFSAPVIAEVPSLGRRPGRDSSTIAQFGQHQQGIADSYRLLRTILSLEDAAPAMRSNGHLATPVSARLDSDAPLSRAVDLPVVGPVTRSMRVRRLESSVIPAATTTPEPPRRALQTILVTSAESGDGKTTVVANLAAAMGEAGRSVLVLDMVPDNAQLARFFQVPTSNGLINALARQRTGRPGNGSTSPLDEVVAQTHVPGVEVAFGGPRPADAASLVSFIPHLMTTARHRAEVVLVDTQSLLASNEANDLISAVDGVIVVARRDRSSSDSAANAADRHGLIQAQMLGVVLLGTRPRRSARFRALRAERHPSKRLDAPGTAPTGTRPEPISPDPQRADPLEPRGHEPWRVGAPAGTKNGATSSNSSNGDNFERDGADEVSPALPGRQSAARSGRFTKPNLPTTPTETESG